MTIKYTEEDRCRFCHSELSRVVLDLGELHPSNFISKDSNGSTKVPLTVVECDECGLVQLKHTVDRDELYRQYWYQSGLNKSMVDSLENVVHEAECYLNDMSCGTLDGMVVVDIGANDGTMLRMFPEGVYTVGFDPAKNLREIAEGNCDVFVNDFFTADAYNSIKLGMPKAKVVTAIAMFYDLGDITPFIKDVESIMADDGVFIVQFTDLATTLKINAVDNICHEHLEYFTLDMMSYILSTVGLKLVNVSYNDVNGGSIRATYAKEDCYFYDDAHDNRDTVIKALWDEREFLKTDSLEKLGERLYDIQTELLHRINYHKEMGDTVAVMGASTKGNTLLQYFGIDSHYIDHAAEINPEKFGLKTIGTNIPIIPEEESLKRNPACYLVLPWHFIDGFVKNNMEYLKGGGEFLIPLPQPKTYSYSDRSIHID